MARTPPDPSPEGSGGVRSLRDHGEELHAAVAEADGLFVLTDFDGTLAPIVDRPEKAAANPASVGALRALAAGDETTVAVVTGRSLSDVRPRLPDGWQVAGNHGLELWTGGERVVHPVAREARSTIHDICGVLVDELADVDGALVEDKGVTATVHYRLADEDDAVKRRALDTIAACDDGDDVRVTSGKQILELRPPVDWGKGDAVNWLVDRTVPADEDWLTMYLGDDVTDESAFRALDERGVGVKVGSGDTAADYRVDDTDAVARLLATLASNRAAPVEFLRTG